MTVETISTFVTVGTVVTVVKIVTLVTVVTVGTVVKKKKIPLLFFIFIFEKPKKSNVAKQKYSNCDNTKKKLKL